MGASCSKGTTEAVDPVVPEPHVELEQLKVDDSAADCIPAGYRAKRRQAVSDNLPVRHNGGSPSTVLEKAC